MAQPLRSASRRRDDRRRVVARRARAAGPRLRVVPRRRRWPALVVGTIATVLLAGMLGAAVFHTQLAERQLRIDRLERGVAAERDRFDELRNERATLRSPQRIASEAERLGMVRGDTATFVEIDPMALARQIAAAGVVDEQVARLIEDDDPLQQFRDVKSVSAGQP